MSNVGAGIPKQSRIDYVIGDTRNAMSEPGANRPELQKLGTGLENFKASDPGGALAFDKALREKANGKDPNDERFTNLVSERPDLINKHLNEIKANPAQLSTILNTMEQESRTTAKPAVKPVSAAPESIHLAAIPQTKNEAVNQAAQTLDTVGHPRAARQLAESSPKCPVGMSTTIALGICGNPRAATSLLGSVAPEWQSPETRGMFKMAGMAAMFQMLPIFGQMLSGIGSGIAGAFTNSTNVASMSNVPGSPLSANFMAGIGAQRGDISIRSIDPSSGAVGTYGAATPSINSPAVAGMQRTPTLVAGMSNGPSGMNGPS